MAQARASSPATQSLGTKKNAWVRPCAGGRPAGGPLTARCARAQFQIHTDDYEVLREKAKPWKSSAYYRHPLVLEILLDVSGLKCASAKPRGGGGAARRRRGDGLTRRRSAQGE